MEESRGTEDGRTEDLTVQYESASADESWDEFTGRVQNVGSKWRTEKWVDGEQKSYGRQVIRGVEFPEYS
jgi:hypothetical protein